ncbi:30S ribosome-binding factor RbfA [Candidatus Falkowbacteria bacterium]|nr:30S ribosome-binding factor RbfA [Candidatus Falkowbacteria bacterium]
MSHREKQLNQLIATALGEVINKELELPTNVFITIAKIDVAANLNSCKVFISAIPSDKTNFAVGFLVKNKGLIKRELSKRIKYLRTTPELTFIPDFTEEKAFEIEKIIDRVAGERLDNRES